MRDLEYLKSQAAGKERGLMYRRVIPASRQELPLRMLFQPLGDGTFHRAAEADSFRALVAAILDDPTYETSLVGGRLIARLRLADDEKLLHVAQTALEGRLASQSTDARPDGEKARVLAHIGGQVVRGDFEDPR